MLRRQEEKQELKDLFEHHIADERRNEIALNYKNALAEQKPGKLKFSSSINELKKMLQWRLPSVRHLRKHFRKGLRN